MRNDRNVIYKGDKVMFNWIDKQFPDLASKMFLTPYIGNVSELKIEFADESYAFATDYSDETDLTVTYKGAKQEPKNFKRLYQLLVTAYAEDYSTEEIAGTPVLTLTYTYKDGTVDKMELYPSTTDSRKNAIVVNGEKVNFLMRNTFVERVKMSVSDLFEGKEIVMDW